jgi:hypothetical protein
MQNKKTQVIGDKNRELLKRNNGLRGIFFPELSGIL